MIKRLQSNIKKRWTSCFKSIQERFLQTLLNYKKTCPLCVFFLFSASAYAGFTPNVKIELEPFQQLKTSAARSSQVFTINGEYYLAIAQFAEDFPGGNNGLDGGKSDYFSLVYRWNGKQFEIFQKIPSHGGRDLEYFQINNVPYLALANLRTGSGPYQIKTDSTIYKWDGAQFSPIQSIPTSAGQEWTAFNMDDTPYLAISNYAQPEKQGPNFNTDSVIYRWDGKQFQATQSIPTDGAFTWEFFSIHKKQYIAVANGASNTSVIYQWDGKQFQSFQTIHAAHARDIKYFTMAGAVYLGVANLTGDSEIFQWDGAQFKPYQTIQGSGGRRLVFFERKGQSYLVKINYLVDGNVAKESQLYAWNGKTFEWMSNFPSSGGTDANYFSIKGRDFLVVSNGHKSKTSFKTDSTVFEIK